MYVQEILRLRGCPRNIVSDPDKILTSLFWEELFRAMGTQLKRSTAYHPQIDGQTEVVNRGIETYLRCFTMQTPSQWAMWLAWAEFSYNIAVHAASNMTPFEVIYGRPPSAVLPYIVALATVDEVDTQLRDCDAMLELLKANLLKAQQRMTTTANAKHGTSNLLWMSGFT